MIFEGVSNMKKAFVFTLVMVFGFNVSLSANPLFKFFGKLFTKEATKQTVKQVTKQTMKQTTKQAGKHVAKQTAKNLGKESAESGIKIGLKQGAKVLAKNSDDIAYPLIKKVTFETAEHAVTNPKIMQKLVVNYGDDVALSIIKKVPPSEMPKFLRYMDAADSPATRKLFIECYKKEGTEIFKRITPQMVMATGLSASMIYGTYRATTPMVATAESIEKSPEVANNSVNKFQDSVKDVLIGILSKPILFITIILCLLILNKFGIFGKLYNFLKQEFFYRNTTSFNSNIPEGKIKPIIPVIFDSDSDRY